MSLAATLSAIATMPMATLVDGLARIDIEPVLDGWDLPASDKVALRSWGLPPGPLLVVAYQKGIEPQLIPNDADPREARLTHPSERLYELGWYGAKHVRQDGSDNRIRVGAVARSGRVLGIRRRPVTVDDLPPVLHPHYPDLYSPAVAYFNASVAAFVETAWRWYVAVDGINAVAGPAIHAPAEEHMAHFEDGQYARQQFLAAIVELDPTVGDERLASLWVSTIMSDL
jgi:hypothetical protein